MSICWILNNYDALASYVFFKLGTDFDSIIHTVHSYVLQINQNLTPPENLHLKTPPLKKEQKHLQTSDSSHPRYFSGCIYHHLVAAFGSLVVSID